jgi:hypothetical protein
MRIIIAADIFPVRKKLVGLLTGKESIKTIIK